jgi:hypothetical protein
MALKKIILKKRTRALEMGLEARTPCLWKTT